MNVVPPPPSSDYKTSRKKETSMCKQVYYTQRDWVNKSITWLHVSQNQMHFTVSPVYYNILLFGKFILKHTMTIRINVPWPTTGKRPFSYRFKIQSFTLLFFKDFFFFKFPFSSSCQFLNLRHIGGVENDKVLPHVPLKKWRTPTN